MKYAYSGNMESLSALVDKIKNEKKVRFFATNDIIDAKISDNLIVFSGIICKAIGELKEQNGSINIHLKVRLKRQFFVIGLLVLFFLSGFVWGENVAINGDSDPGVWKRIGFFSLGLASFSIPALMLLSLRKDFEAKIAVKLKKEVA